MPFALSEIDNVYKKILAGEPDLNSFSDKEVAAVKDNLDSVMQTKPELVKAFIRVGIMKSTGTILNALMSETKECAPVAEAVATIIAKTLEYKAAHGDDVDSQFFAETIKAAVDKTWLAMQAAFAEHQKETKQEN